MSKLYKWTLACILSVSSLCHADVSDTSMNKLLDLSGITKQVNQAPSYIKLGIDQFNAQSSGTMPASDYAEITSSFEKVFVPSEMLKEVRAALQKSINEKEAKKLLVWYESKLGKEITKAEEDASSAESYQDMQALAASLLADKNRVDFANRLDLLVGGTDSTFEHQKRSIITAYSINMAVNQPDTPIDLQNINANIESQKDIMRAMIKEAVIISFLYSYRNISLDKLNKYENFLKKDTTLKFNNAVRDALIQVLEKSQEGWFHELAKLKKTNSKS